MNEKGSSDRPKRKTAQCLRRLPSRSAAGHASQITNREDPRESRLATRHCFSHRRSAIRNRCNSLETRDGTRSNRHGSDTTLIALFASTNVVSAPRRVLASPFSALGVPSPRRNLRVHRAYPPGGGIVMLIPSHSTNFAVAHIPYEMPVLTCSETVNLRLPANRRVCRQRFSNFAFHFQISDLAFGEVNHEIL